jgi:hypothetical protein
MFTYITRKCKVPLHMGSADRTGRTNQSRDLALEEVEKLKLMRKAMLVK